MPNIQKIQFIELQVGSAQTFRENINENFEKINGFFQEFDLGNGIIVSATQPTDQKVGDFWYKIL